MSENCESFVYDGRRLVGLLKPLANGSVEAFVADDDGRFDYIGKAESRKDAAAIVHARRARLEGAPTEHAAE